ncbi:protein PIN-LIKES 2-like [Salvia splendens]|uniref:protein PIN-LIKES 2-like n=1 Tax=Salvia splendens TaxID=180675 RepID=UPI001C25180E|nr:protein PIN-LIKES 2-like [Salvia splendens]
MFGHDCKKKGVAYVSFAQCVSVIVVYTLVYHMMEPPLEQFETVEWGEQQKSVEMSGYLVVQAEWPGIDVDGDGNESRQEAVGCFAARKMRIVAEQTIPLCSIYFSHQQ